MKPRTKIVICSEVFESYRIGGRGRGAGSLFQNWKSNDAYNFTLNKIFHTKDLLGEVTWNKILLVLEC